jgi:cyclase
LLEFIYSQNNLDAFEKLETETFKNIVQKVVKIKNSYYMIKPENAIAGNIGVYEDKKGLILIDNQWKVTKEHVIKALKQINNKEIIYIINTHFHYDHADGNRAFSKMGIPIISHRNVKNNLKNDITIYEGFTQPKHPESALPSITFEKKMELNLAEEVIEIFHFGSAHTDGDAVIKFKNANIIHAGDLFVTYGFPFIDINNGGSLDGFINTLSKIIDMSNDSTIIIPGHGDLSDLNDVKELKIRLQFCIDEIRKQKLLGINLNIILDTLKIDLDGGFKESFFKIVYDSI